MSKTYGITIKQNSQNIANNTSNVTVDWWIKCDSGSYSNTARAVTLTIDGTTYTGTSKAPASTTTSLLKQTLNIAHNSNGTKTLSVSATYKWQDGSTLKSSASKALTAIPRSATLTSVTNTTTGGACTFRFTPTTTTYTYVLTMSCNGVSATQSIAAQSSLSEYSDTFSMPVSTWNKAIPNSETGTVTASLATFNGSTQVGSASTKTFTLTADTSCKPSPPSIILSPINGLDEKYVQNKSSISVTTSSFMAGSEPTGGATVNNYTVTLDDGTQIGSGSGTTYTSGVITRAGTITVTVKATDTRGRSTSSSQNITVYEYQNPVVSLSVYRSNSSGTANNNGTYGRVLHTITCSPVGGSNTTSITSYSYKAVGGTATNLSTSTNPQVFGGGGLSTSTQYVVTITVTDTVGNTTTATANIPTAEVMMNLNPNGKGIGIGKVSEYGYNFEVARPIDAVYGIEMYNPDGVETSNIGTSNDFGKRVNPARRTSANLAATGVAGMNHFLATSAMLTGKPSADGHIMHLSWDANNNFNAQLFVPNNDNAGESIQWRTQAGVANWSGRNWTTVLDENNWSNYITIPKSKYVSGDKFEIVDGDSLGLQIPGIVTTSTQLVHVELHMPYSMENVTPSITALKGYIRGISGYLDNTSSTNQNYITSSSVTVTCTKITNYILRINITKTGNGTWSNTTNNTPVSLQANSITINFT